MQNISTPWGMSQHSSVYGDGIVFYGTAGHGGIKLSPEKNAKVPAAMRQGSGWYEEDCEAAKVVFTFPEVFKPETVKASIKILKDYFPKAYEKATGETVSLEESRTLGEEAFKEANKENYVVIAASRGTDEVPEDMVVGIATIGGERGHFGKSVAEKVFLIPREEYQKRSRYGFVVDPARHQETDRKMFY